MNDEFQVILDYLDTEDSSLKAFADKIITLCASPSGVQEAINELNKKVDYYRADNRTIECVPFCDLLLSFAYWRWGDRLQAVKCADEAANLFFRCGDRWNRALSIWGKAVIYQENYADQAITEYKSAYKLFSSIAKGTERRDTRMKFEYSKSITEQIRDKINNLENRVAESGTTKSTSDKNFTGQLFPWPIAQITSGVNDFGHASRVGKYVFDDEQISEMAINEIAFDGINHNLYNLREGTQISTRSSGDYRWLRVAGNSMNLAEPVPIEPGDYILADLSLSPQIGDIVVANLNNPPTPAERAGVVKRYNNDGVKSESTESIDPIPLAKVNIRGVVLAVAKPV